ncbi:hypothetical protein [Streptomyces natalensis]|uniref:Allantoicase domain-containing protein n=1 Tax=Streptomyces natalensis ATCC 27448 TaxID=1240678 RepID=A0A0D7CTI8_9ACTN|nr:hypothetical protein [Streptomyces natalensis]KIZ19175.1 hypothetical protein SNA_01055 [Streptomyces natalensis ATCC 27448]
MTTPVSLLDLGAEPLDSGGTDDAAHDGCTTVRLARAGTVHRVALDLPTNAAGSAAVVTTQGASLAAARPADLHGAGTTLWSALTQGVRLGDRPTGVLDVAAPERWTHVRVLLSPPEPVSKVRVLGEVVPDPSRLEGRTVDVLAQDSGAVLLDYSGAPWEAPVPPTPLGTGPQTLTGTGSSGTGWEPPSTAWSSGSAWAQWRLAAHSVVEHIEVDTRGLRHPPAGHASVSAMDATTADAHAADTWFPLLEAVSLRADRRYRFSVARPRPATHVRLDLSGPGGLARLRIWGRITGHGVEQMRLRWLNTLPRSDVAALLLPHGLAGHAVDAFVTARPYPTLDAAQAAAHRVDLFTHHTPYFRRTAA